MNSTTATTSGSSTTTTTASSLVGSVPAIVLPSDTNCPVTMANNNLNGKLPKMYNLNVNVNVSAANSAITNFLAVESNCTTPRTPEILNSLMAMSNPLDDYNYNASEKCAVGGLKGGSGNDSASNSSGSPLGSPANGLTPSVQKTCSDLIKAGLKLSIESKRKMSGSDSMDGLPCPKKLKKEEPFISEEDDYEDSYSGHKNDELTPEDEERRRRRRERNKIAATKCRLKKRERTVNLVNEAEVLEAQNIDLKAQIQTLQGERQHLANMINHHEQSCAKRGNNNSSPTAPYNPIQPPYESPNSYPISATPYEPNSPYIRPESANILATSYCDLENPPPSNYSQPVDPIDIPSSYSIPMSDEHYMRHTNQNNYINGDETYNIKSTSHLLNIDSPDNEYIASYENQEIIHNQYNEHTSQQCHNMNPGGSRQKFTGMDNGCMA